MKLSSGNLSAWLVVIVLLAVIGVLSSFVVSFFRGEADEVAGVTVPKMVEISMANRSISEAYIATLRAVLTENADDLDAFIRTVDDRSGRTTTRLDSYGELPKSGEEKTLYTRLLEARERYFATRDKVLSALRSGQREEAQELSQTDLQTDFATYDQLSSEMLDAHAATLRAGADSVANRASVLQILTGSISSALFLIAFLIGLFLGLLLAPVDRVLGRDHIGKDMALDSSLSNESQKAEKVLPL
jgi:hypothetical protein